MMLPPTVLLQLSPTLTPHLEMKHSSIPLTPGGLLPDTAVYLFVIHSLLFYLDSTALTQQISPCQH